MEANRRQRIVKRTPLLKRIVNAPEDYMMKFEGNIRALDWDTIQERMSWPLAVALNVLLITVKVGYWLDDPYASVPSILRTDRSHYRSKSVWPRLTTFQASFEYMLVGVSFLNAIWLFQSKRNYKMMHRSPDEAPSASDCKMVELQRDVSHWSSRLPGRLVYYFITPFTGSSQVKAQKLQVWEMSIWNPSILSRKLFCWFSPAQVLIMSSIDSDNIHIFLPLSIVVAAQVHFLVSVYQSYIKDKQLLFGEMQREYNDKFVHPRIFVRKFDKQVSTETDTSDMGLQTFDGRRKSSRGSSLHNTESTSKRFQHLRVPASSSPLSLPDGVSRFRAPLSSPTSSLSKSSRSSGSLDSGDSESEDGSEDSEEEEEEEEEEVEDSEQDDDDEDHTESDNASNEGGSDPDVDYDEEGEEPAMPHPTNALCFID